ncbi:MAG TPA: 3-hydroxyacyl-CoA dehydrogenase NAD-binding domain-containing protein [Candidatus Baltobacteraceae bacterium]|nr:3-hydroxyacyl-CoA dehydrogenase NAD-binding domain-containing protein [Candidatus Baltobacteraceae bacterium]
MQIAVVGAGQMGSGIAQVAAMHHHSVVLVDRDEASVNRGTMLTHIRPEIAIKDFEVDVAIEAATENLELKTELFRALDQSTPPEAILAVRRVQRSEVPSVPAAQAIRGRRVVWPQIRSGILQL